MKPRKLLSVLLLNALLLNAFAGCARQNDVDSPSEDFVLGMDASCVPALEKSGVTYYNYDGQQQDVFQILAQAGMQYIRVRVWNNPYDEEGHGFGGGNCDIHNAIEIGKRATKYGMKLLVDFHYSDFWADPGKQFAPRAWENMDVHEKADALYTYTRQCLMMLKQAGVEVGMVQVGNETNTAMAGEQGFDKMHLLFSAGAKAIREVLPEALVVLHFTNPEKAGSYEKYAKLLQDYQVDYDVFASSYYPHWHGSLENLSACLTHISETYHVKVMVAETSYSYTYADTDFSPNSVSAQAPGATPYPISVQGQTEFIRDIIKTVAQIPGGIGVFYWEGTWISVGQTSWEDNHNLWEKYGSGWASSYASDYDPQDAGKYYGGCGVENQALFDPSGRPLSSLQTFVHAVKTAMAK